MTLKQQWRTLLKSSFILFLLVLLGCNTPLQEVKSEVKEVDSSYSIEISDYDKGLTYFHELVRNESLNPPKLDKYCNELASIKEEISDKEALAYMDFRINLCKAERLYKMSIRPTTEGYRSPYIKCSQKNVFDESFSQTRKAMNLTRRAMKDYMKIKEKTRINSSWINTTREVNENISKKIEEKERMFSNFCSSNQTE